MVTKRVSPDALSSECMQLAQKWLSECINSHSGCNGSRVESGWRPRRLIYVGSSQDEPRLLVNTGGITGQYIALSHCWGKTQPLTSTSSVISERQRGIPLSSMPPTFQDAVAVARRFGFEYLWIDSLCIIQDSATDWEEQAAQMQNVYEGAVLTLAADAGRDGPGGFTSVRGRTLLNGIRIPGENLFVTCTIQRGETPAHVPDYVYRVDVDSVLQTRGWVLQERLLSRRILHFGEYEMAWECGTRAACECEAKPVVQVGEPPWRTLYNVDWYFQRAEPELELLVRWMTLVQKFTARKLTFESDKLPALAGLAARAAKEMGWTYLAGLWVEQLPMTLLWTAGSLHSGVNSGERHESYQCPSWSWASVHGCEIRHSVDPLFEPEATVLRVACTPRPGNEFGAVEDGLLELECPAAKAHVSRHKTMTDFGKAMEPGETYPAERMMKVVSVVDAGILTEPSSSSPDVKMFEEFTQSEYLFLRIGHRDFTPTLHSKNKNIDLGFNTLQAKRIVRGLVVRQADKRKDAFERIGVHQYALPPESDDLRFYEKGKFLIV